MKTESKLKRLLDSGHFVVCGEIGPPKHACPERLVEKTLMLKDFVDAINLTDNHKAVVRLSSIAAAVHVLRAGSEPIIQMTVRDRNIIGLQSDLLGAYSLGIKNLLCLTGDHPSVGNHPTATMVKDVDVVGLIRIAKKMRDEKRFACGEEIKGQEPRFFIGAVTNPFMGSLNQEVERLEKKVEAGAQFIQTQCVFDKEYFDLFMDLVRERQIHKRAYIIAGVMPLKSAKSARYLQTSVPGMRVPEEVVLRMERTSYPEEEGISLSIEMIEHLKKVEGIAGIHIMTVMWEEIIPTIVREAGLFPRPKVKEVLLGSQDAYTEGRKSCQEVG
ncbi:MAG TPA: methylenetetrahydrofolate reductase [Moorella mulderi]|nr:methylenetetrahydrofolate reductase [Moorella mulderi]